MCFAKRKLAKRLASIGSTVDLSFIVYVNNEDPISFTSYDDAFKYLKNFRQENIIHKLQIYRVETFSL